MGKGLNRLSARSVATATKRGYHLDGGGLYLQVSKAGTKSWIFRYTLNGRTRDMGLGAVDVVDLKTARDAAGECRKLLHAGKDPIASRQAVLAAEAGVPTFKEASSTYIEDHRQGWKNGKHAAQWTSSLETYAYPVIGPKRVDVIATADAMAILRPIWNTKNETANRVRQRCERILDAETVKGHRKGDNPFRWRGSLDTLLPAQAKVKRVKHFAALPYQDMPAFFVQLMRYQDLSAFALQFTILTIARTEMTIGAMLSEFDWESGLWRLTAERMKAKREHQVPIVAYVSDLVLNIHREPGEIYVFPGQRRGHISNGTMLQYLEHMGHPDLTVHGFRSSFKDWASETTEYANEVSEAALAHVIKDKAEAAYRRGQLLEKRWGLMEAWARYCLGRG